MAKKKKELPKKKEKKATQQKIPVKNIVIGVVAVVILITVLFLFLGRDTIVAQVNGEKIHLSAIKDIYEATPESVRTPEIAEQILDFNIQLLLLSNEAESLGITISQEDIDSFDESFSGQLEVVGSDDLHRLVLIKKLIDEVIEVNISEEDIMLFYENNKDQLTIPETVTARHILVATKEEADDIRPQLIDGADFEELAKEKSIDPSAQQNSGNLGAFTRGQMVEAFEYVAFSTKIGIISQPVQTQFGWHIIEVLDKQNERVALFDEVKEKLEDYLINRQQEQGFEQFLTEVLEKAQIEKINNEELIALLQQ